MAGITLSSACHACNGVATMCCLAHELMGTGGSGTYATPYPPSLTTLTNMFLCRFFSVKLGAFCCNSYFLLFVCYLVHAGVEGLLLLLVSWKH